MDAQEIKKHRKGLKLTQGELAELIGVSKRTIINYEQGSVVPETKREILHKVLVVGNVNVENTPILKVGSTEVDLDTIFNFILKNETHILENHTLFKLWISEKVYKQMVILGEDLKSGKV